MLLFSAVYEQRSWRCVVCAALWPWAEGVGWTCLHWYQAWRLHRELQQVKMSESEDQYKRVFLLLTLIWQTILQRRVQPQLVCVFCRKLVIKCSSYKQAQWWSHEIRSLSESCDFLQTHRFEGFAPPRPDTLTKWCVYLCNMSLDELSIKKNVLSSLCNGVGVE